MGSLVAVNCGLNVERMPLALEIKSKFVFPRRAWERRQTRCRKPRELFHELCRRKAVQIF